MIDVTESDLRSALHVNRWVTDVLRAGPFADWAALQTAADEAARPLTVDEIGEAMATHPRIGDRPTGASRADAFSRDEQSAPDVEDQHLAKALAEGNATYEARFDRVFLIRAKGRSRAEIVDELDRRLKLDDAAELEVVGQELREITMLRLEGMFGGAGSSSGAGRLA